MSKLLTGSGTELVVILYCESILGVERTEKLMEIMGKYTQFVYFPYLIIKVTISNHVAVIRWVLGLGRVGGNIQAPIGNWKRSGR